MTTMSQEFSLLAGWGIPEACCARLFVGWREKDPNQPGWGIPVAVCQRMFLG
jgi:hypothetical protein